MTPTTLLNPVTDALAELREAIEERIRVEWMREVEGDPSIPRGTVVSHVPRIRPARVVLTRRQYDGPPFREVEGEQDGVRWRAVLDTYTGRTGECDYDVEAIW